MPSLSQLRNLGTRVLAEFDKKMHLEREISRQLEELAGYTSSITNVQACSPLGSDTIVLFVYYEPTGFVSSSVQRVLRALRNAGADTYLICNHDLSEEQSTFFSSTVHSVIRRGNQGFDFGAWKDAVEFAVEQQMSPRRIVFLNDSVFFGSTGLDEFVTRLLSHSHDAIAAYENWGEDHHLQSFALSVAGEIFESTEFRSFWAGYVPISNRLHAIETGEKHLSRAVMSVARSSSVIYPAAHLYTAILESREPLLDRLFTYPQPWRAWMDALMTEDRGYEYIANKAVELINVTSPIHSGAYFFPRYAHSPLFKKDLVYRSRFAFWEIEQWIGDLLPADEAAEYLGLLRTKSDANALTKKDRRLFNIGAK